MSPGEMHDFLRTVLVAPLTTGARAAPYRVPVDFQGRHGLILLDQLRAVDKQRFVRRLGVVSSDVLAAALGRLREMFED
jgi:mRNA interferase MazF